MTRNCFAILLACLLLFMPLHVAAEDARFAVEDIQTELHEDGVYYLSARLDVSLGSDMLSALRNGVSLVLQMDFELNRPRRFWKDDRLVSLEQRYQLRFHALTKQYTVSNLNTGIQESFHTLHGALDYFSRIRSLPIFDAGLLQQGASYRARLRLHLDLGALPLVLQIRAYTNRNWRISSPWMVWTMPL